MLNVSLPVAGRAGFYCFSDIQPACRQNTLFSKALFLPEIRKKPSLKISIMPGETFKWANTMVFFKACHS